MAADIERPDPEVQAGCALRRLRLSQRWSQEEVARRMRAYGYDFHQTMIAKIEAAQRPLRVRELVDFAALYGVEVHELIYPPNSSLEEIDLEITEVRAQLETAQQEAEAAAADMHQARAALAAVEDLYQSHAREVAVLSGRLGFLQKEREKFPRGEADQEPAQSYTFEFDFRPDPSAAITAAEFTAALRRYRAWAGNPSFRSMARRAGQIVTAPTMHAAMRGNALPGLHVVEAIITGCGGSEEDLREFAAAWRRIDSGNAKRSSTERAAPTADHGPTPRTPSTVRQEDRSA